MSEVNKLFDALSSDGTKQLTDLKFFLGDKADNVEDVARECRLAIEQDRKGLLKVS